MIRKGLGTVCIATRYATDGIEFRCLQDFPQPSRRALDYTQPPLKWIRFFMVCDTKGSRHSLHSNSLRNGRDRISVFARFSATFQTGTGFHPASRKTGFGFLFFSGGKKPGHDIYYPPVSGAEVKERLEHTFLPF